MTLVRRRPSLRYDTSIGCQEVELLRGFQKALLKSLADHPVRLRRRFEVPQYAAATVASRRIVIAELVERGLGDLGLPAQIHGPETKPLICAVDCLLARLHLIGNIRMRNRIRDR